MTERTDRFRLLVLGALLFLTCVIWVPMVRAAFVVAEEGLLKVHFLDVGQGDAIFIETPEGKQMLIDGGADTSVLRELGQVMGVADRTIDVVVATHPDQDHIGGLVHVLERYKVEQMLHTTNEGDTAIATVFAEAVAEEDATEHIAEAGQVWVLGAETTFHVYSPTGDPAQWESNTASVVAQLRYGDSEFMLTGDAPVGIEDYLVRTYGTALESEVLKLGHHGSKTSSGQLFLQATSPQYAVVSAGKDNRYGHPHQEVLDRVVAENIDVLETAKEGRITFISDGRKVWLEE